MKTKMRLIGALIWAGALAAPAPGRAELGGAGPRQEAEPFKRLTVEELDAKIKESRPGKPAVYVFDNNPKELFRRAHIPGARWVHYDALKAADLPADKGAMLVFYCANEQCGACHAGAVSALRLGYKNVYILPAGIMGWEKAQKPVEKG